MVESNTAKRISRTKKIVLGFAGATAAVVVGTAGIAAAQTPGNTGALPTSRAECASWQNFSFQNRSQCESWWDNQSHGSSGYGNGNNNHVETNLNLDVSGNNNVINIALNYMFGR